MAKYSELDTKQVVAALEKQGFDLEYPSVIREFVTRYGDSLQNWQGSAEDLVTKIAVDMSKDASNMREMQRLEEQGLDDPSSLIELGLYGPKHEREPEPDHRRDFGRGLPGNQGTDLIRDALYSNRIPGPPEGKPAEKLEQPDPEDISEITNPAELYGIHFKREEAKSDGE